MKVPEPVLCTFAIIGVIATLFYILKRLYYVLRGVRAFFLPIMCKSNLRNRYGSWAVVTGCTDGIGREYARQLARNGLNVVLISRSKEKLDALSREIMTEFGVKTKVIVVDFSGGLPVYRGLKEEVNELDIGILINNVGIVQPIEYFLDTKPDLFSEILNVNCLSVLMMTQIILPGMLSRKKGAIVNISSFAGQIPVPFLQVYSATKSFIDFFSSCLRQEYADKGVDVQCLLPVYVSTKMSCLSPSFDTPSSETYVRQALGVLGIHCRTQGYWAHALQAYVLTSLPIWLRKWVIVRGLRVVRRAQHMAKATSHE